jgi:transposase-like protein
MPFFDEIPADLEAFNRRYPDEPACRAHIRDRRWPNGFVCPKCSAADHYYIRKRELWQCANKDCRKQTSLTSGTIFHATKRPLLDWFKAAFWLQYEPCSAEQVAQRLGIQSSGAWEWLAKIRTSVADWIALQPSPRVAWARLGAMLECTCRGELRGPDWLPTPGEPPLAANVREQVFTATCGKVSEKHLFRYLAVAMLRVQFRGLAFVEALLQILATSSRRTLREIVGPRPVREPIRFVVNPPEVLPSGDTRLAS